DRTLDQIAAVVSGDDFHAFGQGRLDLLQLLVNPIDDPQRVLTVTHHDDAAHDLAFAVQFGNAAAEVGSQMNRGDVFDIDRRAIDDLERDVLEVLDAFDRSEEHTSEL